VTLRCMKPGKNGNGTNRQLPGSRDRNHREGQIVDVGARADLKDDADEEQDSGNHRREDAAAGAVRAAKIFSTVLSHKWDVVPARGASGSVRCCHGVQGEFPNMAGEGEPGESALSARGGDGRDVCGPSMPCVEILTVGKVTEGHLSSSARRFLHPWWTAPSCPVISTSWLQPANGSRQGISGTRGWRRSGQTPFGHPPLHPRRDQTSRDRPLDGKLLLGQAAPPPPLKRWARSISSLKSDLPLKGRSNRLLEILHALRMHLTTNIVLLPAYLQSNGALLLPSLPWPGR
jgi:hypothetical protein